MKSQPISSRISRVISSVSLIAMFLLIFGCSGDTGLPGLPGASSGTVAGTITDDFSPPNNVAGATVTPSPQPQGVTPVTADASGKYSITLPNGNYTLTFSRNGYNSQTQPVTVISGQTTTLNVTLIHNAAAVVNVANAKFVNGKATLTANVAVFDPALKGQPITFTWLDSAGNTVGTTSSVTVNQPSTAALKANLANLVAPRQGLDPPGTPGNEEADANEVDVANFQTLDRMMVVGIPQKAFEDGANPPYTVTATIAGQKFTAIPTVSMPANTVPFVPNPGLRNVPIGQPVMLQGHGAPPVPGITPPPATQTTWNWTIVAPSGSNVTALVDPTTRFPSFIPDAVGTYTITESVSGQSLTIYAGKYVGILVPALPNNDPVGALDTACSQAGCHASTSVFGSTTIINANFTAWKQSGHSVIMVKGMQEGSHYDINSCGKCHSVGYAQYSSAIKAGGFKDVINATGFTNATFLANAPTFFKGFDQVLRVSEVQCETCHGPNSSGAHATFTTNPQADQINARISYSADVCGVCHGEPKRHGRYQEWRESGHGDFETAIGEAITGKTTALPDGTGPSARCVGCHSGQGYIQFIQQLESGFASRTLSDIPAGTFFTNVNYLRSSNVQPIVCVACHTPHNPGQQPGIVGNIVILRGGFQAGGAFAGITPLLPAGFQANGVGRGALCITCHNSRNGEAVAGSGVVALHEDNSTTFGTQVSGTANSYAAPHDAAQGDVLMGRNAYFVTGQRSKHSFLADACVTCHLQKAPTDPSLGYPPNIEGAGTNHTFAIVNDPTRPAADQINALCHQCHSFTGTDIQNSFTTSYNQMLVDIANAIYRIKTGGHTPQQDGVQIVFNTGSTPSVTVTASGVITTTNVSTYLANAPGTPATGPIGASGYVPTIAKANWNASLVNNDSSLAVHNPGFAFDVVTSTSLTVRGL